jgi:hypothetical protein
MFFRALCRSKGCCGIPRIGQNHSHSILLTHRNELIYKRKIFLLTVQIRPSVRQIFLLLISKENSRDSNSARLRQLSPTIGQFFALSIAERILRQDEKRPSAPIAQGVRAGHVCALLITYKPGPLRLMSPIAPIWNVCEPGPNWTSAPKPRRFAISEAEGVGYRASEVRKTLTQSCLATRPRAPKAHRQVVARSPAAAAAF